MTVANCTAVRSATIVLRRKVQLKITPQDTVVMNTAISVHSVPSCGTFQVSSRINHRPPRTMLCYRFEGHLVKAAAANIRVPRCHARSNQLLSNVVSSYETLEYHKRSTCLASYHNVTTPCIQHARMQSCKVESQFVGRVE